MSTPARLGPPRARARRGPRRALLRVLLTGLAGASLAACGAEPPPGTGTGTSAGLPRGTSALTSADPAGGTSAVTSADPAPPHQDETPATSLRLGLTEWSIEASSSLLAPGTVEVVVTNTGGTGHDVRITGEAGTWTTPVLATGEQAELTLQTMPGEELSLDCTLAGHHAAGMHRTLTVAQEP